MENMVSEVPQHVRLTEIFLTELTNISNLEEQNEAITYLFKRIIQKRRQTIEEIEKEASYIRSVNDNLIKAQSSVLKGPYDNKEEIQRGY